MNTTTTLSKGSWIRLNERRAARTGMLLLLLLLTLPAALQAQFTYVTNNGTITITGYTGPVGAVSIPDRIPQTANGLPVTSIGDFAFSGCGLTSVTFGTNVTRIGIAAFSDCHSLANVTIPKSVTAIGSQAFYDCTRLIAITVDTNNPAYSSVAGVLFNKSQTTLIQCPGRVAGAYTIPNGVTSIGDEAFLGCNSLTSITIPGSVTKIGTAALEECTSLTTITIPNSVTSIGDNAFMSCTNLTTITIANSVTSIGGSVFSSCYSLTNVTIPNSVTNIGSQAFVNCTSLTSLMIGSSVTFIGDWAFGDCYSLANVTIPNDVINIGSYAFAYCTSLTSATIPKSVTSIGSQAFRACSSLTAITVDALNPAYSSVAGILFNKSQTTLIQCPGGKPGSFAIPNSVTSTISDAFLGCSSLTAITVDALNPAYSSVDGILFDKSQTTLIQCPGGKAESFTIPNSVTTIGDAAFASCSSLTNVTIPNGVTTIGDWAFDSCTGLRSVTIGNSVISIGDSAFDYCTNLTSVSIPNGVTNIGNYAFAGCFSLTSVYFQGNAPSLGWSVFDGDTNATVYYLPGTTGWGTTFGGRPTALWTPANPPTIQRSPQTQTAEAGSAVGLQVKASGSSPLFCLWYLNTTSLISCSTSRELELTNVQFSQSGAYTAVITNVAGAVTSAPTMLNVIAAVERRPVPGVKVTGETGSLVSVDYADSLSPAPNWTTLGSVSLTSTTGYCCDPTLPLRPQRFYRAWQTGTPGVRPFLDLHPVPAITVTGTIGHSVRVDCINQFGPNDAWVTLATVSLTNTSQLYFDISAPGQPPRLYRLVPSP